MLAAMTVSPLPGLYGNFYSFYKNECKLQVNPGAKLLLKGAQECYLSSWMRELKQDVCDPCSR